MRSFSMLSLSPRRWFCVLLSGFALCASSAQAQPPAAGAADVAAPDADAAVARATAERGLAEYVQRKQQAGADTPAAGLALDVADLQALSGASIAYGFPVYTIAPQDLVDGRGDLRSLARPTGTWRFAVRVDGRPVGLVTVARIAGQWQPVSFGGAGLAAEVDALMAAHANAERSNVRFIRIFQAQSDLFEVVSPDGQAAYGLLRSARASLGAGTGEAADGLRQSRDLAGPLRAAVMKNMAAAR